VTEASRKKKVPSAITKSGKKEQQTAPFTCCRQKRQSKIFQFDEANPGGDSHWPRFHKKGNLPAHKVVREKTFKASSFKTGTKGRCLITDWARGPHRDPKKKFGPTGAPPQA